MAAPFHSLKKMECGLGRCSDVWNVADSTTTRKCKWLFVNGCGCRSPISTVTKYWNSWKHG